MPVLHIKITGNADMNSLHFIKDLFYGRFNILFSRGKKNNINGFFITTGSLQNLYFKKLRRK